jgi:hypothetical protein
MSKHIVGLQIVKTDKPFENVCEHGRTKCYCDPYCDEREKGFAVIVFADMVEFEPSGAMVTGPWIYAQREDGTWVESSYYLRFARGGFTECSAPELVIDKDALSRKAQQFGKMFGESPVAVARALQNL